MFFFWQQHHGASDPTWQMCLWFWCASLAKHNISAISTVQHLRTHLSNMDCIVCLFFVAFFLCVAQLPLFLLFLSVLSFGLLYGSFYNEVVLCDDQKLWCSSFGLKYLMSLKYGLKSVWTSDPAALVDSFVRFEKKLNTPDIFEVKHKQTLDFSFICRYGRFSNSITVTRESKKFPLY